MIPSILAATSDADWAIIADLAVILVSAAVVAVIMQPMRLAAIPAYLNAGVVIGLRAVMACLDANTAEEPLGTIPESDLHTVSRRCDEGH